MDSHFPRFVITEEDIRDFHRKHFPNAPVPFNFFSAGFGTPAPAAQTASDPATAVPTTTTKHEDAVVADEAVYGAEYEGYYEGEEDDGLGYYPDGVKRTLTDEDVAFFRRSELLQMLKDAKRRVAERKDLEEDLEALKDRETPARELQEECETRENREQVDELKQSKEKEPTPILEQGTPLDPVTPPELENARLEVIMEPYPNPAKPYQNPVPKAPTVLKDDNIASKGKKRKRKGKDVEPRRTEDDGVTYRRIARELDEQPNVSVELDY